MNLDLLYEAVNILIYREDYEKLKLDIMSLAGTDAGAFAPPFHGLNPLVEYARVYPGRLQPLWDLLDRKHRQIYPETNEAHLSYHRDYMRARRERLRKARLLLERLTGAEIRGDKRRPWEATLQAMWMEQRDATVERTPDMTHDQHLELVNLFWADVEEQLDAGLAGDEQVARRILGL